MHTRFFTNTLRWVWQKTSMLWQNTSTALAVSLLVAFYGLCWNANIFTQATMLSMSLENLAYKIQRGNHLTKERELEYQEQALTMLYEYVGRQYDTRLFWVYATVWAPLPPNMQTDREKTAGMLCWLFLNPENTTSIDGCRRDMDQPQTELNYSVALLTKVEGEEI